MNEVQIFDTLSLLFRIGLAFGVVLYFLSREEGRFFVRFLAGLFGPTNCKEVSDKKMAEMDRNIAQRKAGR